MFFSSRFFGTQSPESSANLKTGGLPEDRSSRRGTRVRARGREDVTRSQENAGDLARSPAMW